MLRRALFVCCMVALPNTALAAEPKPDEPTHGPANDIVFEGTFGYGAGVFGAVQGTDPKVTNGPMFHAGVGWAWALRTNQSVGLLAIGEGQFDGDRTTNEGAKLSSRIGAAAALWGEHAHLRLGFGYAHATLNGEGFGGLGVSFAAGWQATITEGNGKRAVFMFEVLPSWDFLGAGSETLHRWNFGLLIGVAAL